MYTFILVILIYMNHFVPWVFSRPLLLLSLSALSASFLINRIESALMILMLLMLFLSFSSYRSGLNAGIAIDEITAVHGYALQDSSQKKERMSGFRLEVIAVEDRKGSVFSSHGELYVLSDAATIMHGDRVRVAGRIDGELIVGSTSLISRSYISKLRHSIVYGIKTRLMRLGEAGELSMRLLLGSGEYGVYTLSEDARHAGLSHVLALSGMHLSILASILSLPLSLLPYKRLKYIVITSFLLFFSFLSGWRPSLLRALIFRLLIQNKVELDEAFMLSALILFSLFPSASSDLGAEYSFISLGGIFLLSKPLDRSLRFLLPLPPSVSLSASASISALLFSIPLTITTFGSYQIGAIITSLPLTGAISTYMGLSLIVLFLPFLSPLLSLSYIVVERLFALSAFLPETTSLFPYILMIVLSFILLLVARRC